MSGSNSGDPPDESGDTDREQRDRSAGASQPPPAAEEPSRNDSDPDPHSVSDSDADAVTIEDDGVLRWFLNTDDESVVMARDVLSSVAIVAAVGLLLFAISGIWPPLVAVESGSMQPNMERGDLVFVVDEGRFAGDAAVDGTGVVTRDAAAAGGYGKFGNPGDVIIFRPGGDPVETPIIHRAHFWVEEGENWVERADPELVGGATCGQVPTCPADHDGFVTKGDNNAGYDQYDGAETAVVRPEWVTGKAMFRIPWLGHIRLAFDSLLAVDPAGTSLDGPSALEAGLVGVAAVPALAGGYRRGGR